MTLRTGIVQCMKLPDYLTIRLYPIVDLHDLKVRFCYGEASSYFRKVACPLSLKVSNYLNCFDLFYF